MKVSPVVTPASPTAIQYDRRLDVVRTPSTRLMLNLSLESLEHMRVELPATAPPPSKVMPGGIPDRHAILMQTVRASNEQLYAVNPSIVLLPPRLRWKLDGAVYAAVLRVGNHNNCIMQAQRMPRTCITLVGFRLLDGSLEPMPGREAIVGWDGLMTRCAKMPYEDCRLSVEQTHGEVARLLLLCKNHLHRITLELDDEAHRLPVTARFDCAPPLVCPRSGTPSEAAHGSVPAAMRHVVRGGLRVVLESVEPTRLPVHGKNFNLFSIDNRRDGLHLEEWVLGPKTPRNLSDARSAYKATPAPGRRLHAVYSLASLAAGAHSGPQAADGSRNRGTSRVGVQSVSSGFYLTTESAALLGPAYPWKIAFGPRMPARAHGGGCCIRLQLPFAGKRWMVTPAPPREGSNELAGDLMLGILHYKLDRMQYLQQLYAFQAAPPFEMVALSRPFCWRDRSTKGPRLYRRGRTYTCPYIQMTMSITPSLHNSTEVVLASGMNDCTSRVIVADVNDLLEQVQMKLS